MVNKFYSWSVNVPIFAFIWKEISSLLQQSKFIQSKLELFALNASGLKNIFCNKFLLHPVELILQFDNGIMDCLIFPLLVKKSQDLPSY